MQHSSNPTTPAEAVRGERVPEARYSYYRRCQVFRKGGVQCKAPAEKGSHICYAHAGQLATAVRRELSGPSRDFTGRTTLPRLAALLERVDAMLANDTGPLHLAAALGRPVVAPYTCTSVRLNGPYPVQSGAIETTVLCRGSYVKRCARLECMAELSPERLWPRLSEVMRCWRSRSLCG